MLNLLKKTKNLIGLEISPEGILMTILTGENKSVSLKQHIYEPFDRELYQNGRMENSDILIETLRKIVYEHKLYGKNAVISVPSSTVFIKKITLPDIPDSELKIIIPQEASKHLPLDIKAMNVDFQMLENTKKQDESGKKVDILICALSKSIAKNYLDIAFGAGLDVDSIDISFFSMIRALAHSELINEPDKTYISVLIGYENTDINIVQNGIPIFSHSVKAGRKNIIEAIGNSLHIKREETLNLLPEMALIIPGAEMSENPDLNKASTAAKNVYRTITEEIQKAIEFFNSDKAEPVNIEKIILGGNGVCIQNADSYIAGKTRVETLIFNPFKHLSKESEQQENLLFPINLPSFSTSVGLALKGFEN